jgi:hypothetical protein
VTSADVRTAHDAYRRRHSEEDKRLIEIDIRIDFAFDAG